jgi:single-stranded DNA-binding protein
MPHKHVNHVTLLGRVLNNPEPLVTASGLPYTRLTLVTEDHFISKSGESVHRAYRHSVILWNNLGADADNLLTQNSLVLIEGAIQSRVTQAPDGRRLLSSEIRASRFIPLGTQFPDSDSPPMLASVHKDSKYNEPPQ